jgi:perosamine synthetase
MDYYHETEELGWRHHMNDLSAAIGIVQLRKLEKHNQRRRDIAAIYDREFANLGWLKTPVTKDYAFTSQHKYVVQVAESDRDALILHLKDKGVASHVHFVPSHLHPAYKQYRSELLPVTETFWRRIVSLPMFPGLTEDEVSQVVDAVKSFPKHEQKARAVEAATP